MALGYMRRHRRWLYVFLWLVIAAFIILYIPAFQGAQAGSPGERLGSVGGLTITVGEFQRSYLRQRQFYERLYQGKADAETLRRLGLEEQVFQGLVTERLVALEAKRLGVSVDDAAVAQEIASSPGYQRDGRFVGTAEIRRLLEMRGLSVEEFEGLVRSELLRRKLESLVAGGVSVSEAEAEREFRRRSEQVKAEYVLVDAARYRTETTAGEDEVAARFEARKADYRIPERRVVDYVLVEAEALKAQVTVTEREVELEYGKRKDELKQEEQVCASHLLIKVKSEDSGEGHAEPEARALAERLRGELQGGADFASVAKRASEDTGSATNGGDLGGVGRGAMVPEFDQAACAHKPGELFELVKTPYGYHVIKVASHRQEATPALPEVQDRLRQGLVAQRVRTMAEEKAAAVQARLEKGDALAKAASQAALKVERSAPFARNELPAPLSSQRLVARAFEMKTKGELEKQPYAVAGGYAFIALAETQAPRDAQLGEVRDKVRADVVDEKARARARETAAGLRERAAKGGLEAAAKGLGLVRKETQGLVSRGQPLGDLGSGASLDDVAFSLKEQLSDPVPVQAGYAVLRILERKGFDPDEFTKQKGALVAALRRERQQKLFEAFLDAARQRVNVERNPEVFRRLVG